MGIKRNKNKNPPIFSHEFFIQNHADIVSCVAMVFLLSLLFQATSPLASIFITINHNVTDLFEPPNNIVLYTYGVKDLALIFFYFLISIVMHAVLQEYLLDKLNRKLHLSKIKHSKFNESGQLLVFYLCSIVWAVEIIRREGYFYSISKLWVDYPHNELSYLAKFYFIIQISYWLHTFPELYFQKVKKDEMSNKIFTSTLYLTFIIFSYVFNFTRIALFLSVIHYVSESLYHISRLLYFAEKSPYYNYGFKLWNFVFVGVRFASIILSVLTFWFGLALDKSASPEESLKPGNFNAPMIRISCLVGICVLQVWMMWNFINFQFRKIREKKSEKIEIQLLKGQKVDDENLSELPEVDQNTKKVVTKSSKKVN